jgi:hypothetical protein
LRYVADRLFIILDANLLFPFRKRDVLLRFSHAGLFRARWSGEILDEWTRRRAMLFWDEAARGGSSSCNCAI